MAPMIFAKAIMEGTPIDVFNYGDMKRDFTYIDGIVESVVRVSEKIPAADPEFDTANSNPSCSNVPYRLYNIGNHQPIELMSFIETLERILDRAGKTNLRQMQLGDVIEIYANTEDLRTEVSFARDTSLEAGLQCFIGWFQRYFRK